MRTVVLGGRELRVDPRRLLGEGGEAEVFVLDDATALKLWKGPEHPDFAGNAEAERAARARLADRPRRLSALPRALPKEVVAPLDRAFDPATGALVGFTMAQVVGAEPLLRLSEPAARRRGLTDDAVVACFRVLHQVLTRLHGSGVTIGDLNDLNVLVSDWRAPRLIDADGMGLPGMPCTAFTERFVDPRLCDPSAPTPVLVRPHDADSDWYAFAALLFQSLVAVGPFGGVHRPARGPALPPSRRALAGVSVFHPDVLYPRPARPLDALSPAAREHFRAVFEGGRRGAFPEALLDRLVGASSAPRAPAAPRAGNLHATTVHACPPGHLLVAARVEGASLLLVQHDGSAYRREDGRVVHRGALESRLTAAPQRGRTWLARRGWLSCWERDGEVLRVAIDPGPRALAVHGGHAFWCAGGSLFRDETVLGAPAPREIGQVLSGHTQLWVGEALGFGLTRANGVTWPFLWDPARGGLREARRVPSLPGTLLHADAAVGADRVWLFLALSLRGALRHVALVYDREGQLLATRTATPGDGTWLGALGGAAAVGDVLLWASDRGLVRVEVRGAELAETRVFPETAPFVHADVQLVVAPGGLFVVGAADVVRLRLEASSRAVPNPGDVSP